MVQNKNRGKYPILKLYFNNFAYLVIVIKYFEIQIVIKFEFFIILAF
jgi:hypothetical protein